MTNKIEVHTIRSPAEHNQLLRFPWCLYRADSNWTPPLLSMRRELLDRQKNPAWQYLKGDYFLAKRRGDDEVLGTIAAFVNPRHNERHGENIAWFGLFETTNDETVARSLLETAINWAGERGYQAIRGPANFTLHAECGLLIENFGPAVLMMSYNPPYYATYLEKTGFQKAMDIHSWAFDANAPKQEEATERALRLAERIQKRHRITLREFNPRDRKNEFLRLRQLYNIGWANNWGFVPMTEAELDALIATLGLLIEPKFCIFAESEGIAIGFVLAIPDLSEALRRARPGPAVPEWLSWISIAWQLKIRRNIRSVRAPLMGIHPDFHKSGAAVLLMASMAQKLYQSDYQLFDTSWILESNHDMNSMLESLGARRYKRHRIYEYHI